MPIFSRETGGALLLLALGKSTVCVALARPLGGHGARLRAPPLRRMALPAQHEWSNRDWENPAVYQRDKQRSHVPLRSFTSPETALRYFTHGPAAAQRARQLSLNSSDWRFQLFDRPENVPAFAEEDFDDSQWSKVGIIPQTEEIFGTQVVQSLGLNFSQLTSSR